MKEKPNQNLNTNNLIKSSISPLSSNISTTTTLNNTISSINMTTLKDTSIQDPYNSQNFMAPPIGATVKCVTCLGNDVQGKVIAYDQQTKMLALRTSMQNKPGFYDYSMVNVAWCSNFQVIEEASENPEPILNLNVQKIERRKRINIDNKYKEINSLGSEVSPLAQHLYFTIYKTLNEVEWDGKNIIVMESVIIYPPYDISSCRGKSGDNQAVEHVKKIVKKFNEEYGSSATQHE